MVCYGADGKPLKRFASFRGSTERKLLEIGYLESDFGVYGAKIIENRVSLERQSGVIIENRVSLERQSGVKKGVL